MTNLPTTHTTLQQQITALTEKLSPVEPDHVARSIRTLLAAGLALPSGMQANKAPELYALALEGIPSYGLHVATAKIIRGEYEINRAFVPTPPELAEICRAEAKVLREDRARLLEKQATLDVIKNDQRPVDEAMRERVRAKLRDFREEDAARRGMVAASQEPVSDEKADYYQRILSLKDAKNVTAEQAAFRRSIANRLPEDERKAAE